MIVTKILETTLNAGQTTVTFTDSDIPNSLLRVYTTDSDIFPISQVLSGNTLTVTYEAQASALDVALEIVKAGFDIVDALNSTDADKALSAKQGNLLNVAIEDVTSNLDELTESVNNLDIPNNLTELDDVNVTSIQNGQVLAWNDIAQKFVNVEQSGGSYEHDYSTTEKLIGTWINGEPLYERTYEGTTPSTSAVSVLIENGSNTSIKRFDGTIGGRGLNSYYDANTFCRTWIAFNGYQLAVFPASSSFLSQHYSITLQYTKTS